MSPLAREEFSRSYYEQRVCFVNRDSPGYYGDLLTLADLDHVLGTHAPKHPDVNIVGAAEIPKTEFTSGEGVIDPVRSAKLFADGSTLIFGSLQSRLPRIAELCTELGKNLSSRVQANIYLTPPSSRGFAPHWDTHDVFVLQIEGTKRWATYGTKITLPLRGQMFEPDKSSPGDVSAEFDLHRGDLAYIPRGLMHSATAQKGLSLHVTIGVMAYTWADVLLQGVAAAALASPGLRANLPWEFDRGHVPEPEKARLLEEKWAEIGAYLREHSPFDYFANELVSKHQTAFTDLLSHVSKLDELTLSSTIGLRTEALLNYRERDGLCVIRCHGNEIQLPEFVAPALRFLLETPRCRVGEIPGDLDDEAKLTLARRLAKEGLLRCFDFAGGPPAGGPPAGGPAGAERA